MNSLTSAPYIGVISLVQAQKRRQHIETQFSSAGLSFEFFDAITPNQAIKIFRDWFPNTAWQSISHGELACLVSHLSLWQFAKVHNYQWLAVFEDDVHLSTECQDYLSTNSWLHANWQLIKLETFLEPTIVSDPVNLMPPLSRKVAKLHEAHFGAAGYLISLDGIDSYWQKISSLTVIKPIDHLLFSDSIHAGDAVWQLTPALCIQDSQIHGLNSSALNALGLQSSLEAHRSAFTPQKPRLTLAQKFAREWHRLRHQTKRITIAKPIPFV